MELRTIPKTRARFLVDALWGIFQRVNTGLTVVEIGAARDWDGEISDGHSTVHLARWAKDAGMKDGIVHQVHSIDLQVDFARTLVQEYGLEEFIHIHRGDARVVLPRLDLNGVDFFYIDAADDPGLTVALYLLGRVYGHEKTVFAFDDWDESDPQQVKGRILKPWLKASGIKVTMRDRIGFCTPGRKQLVEKFTTDGLGGLGFGDHPPGIDDARR